VSLQIKSVVEQWANKDCAQFMLGNSWLQDKIFYGNLCNSVGANPHNDFWPFSCTQLLSTL